MDEQLARIENEAQIILHTDNDRRMFTFYLHRMYARGKTPADIATVDGREVAVGFLEMME